MDWTVTGPEKSLAYILADEGYDVWMGNARGNVNSRNHTTKNPNNADFWAFSWHEIGIYDISAMIDKIIATTGQPKIHYAGHSQGTTAFFVLMSMRPEYNAKIRSAHMFAPVAYMSNLKSPFMRALAPIVDVANLVLSLLGVREFLPSNEMLVKGGQLLCNDQLLGIDGLDNDLAQEICANVFFLICGYDSEQLDRSMISPILANYPAGASVNQVVHYGQEINSGQFRQFDYGLVKNILKYFSPTPPNYPVHKIIAPVMFYYGENDWLAAVSDVQKMADQVPGLIENYKVPLPKFNHLDFLWATDVRTLLYDKLLYVLSNY